MDSCDSHSRSTYNDGTDLEYISSVCMYAFQLYILSLSIVRNITTTDVCVVSYYDGIFMPFFRENGQNGGLKWKKKY